MVDVQTQPETAADVFPFPLKADQIHSLTDGGFVIIGQTTLVAGTITVDNRRIKASSVVIVSYKTISGTIGQVIQGTCTKGVLTLTSYDSGGSVQTGDTSTIAYVIFLDARIM